jgi:methylglutaconyl-CoA hydratase
MPLTEDILSAPAPVLWSLDGDGIATVTLNRPATGNAYDGAMIDGLHRTLDELGARAPAVRVVLFKGAGRHFQAGADLNWLNEVRGRDEAANHAASRATATAIDRLNRLPVPTIALVHGFCVGGGTGLVAASDVAIAEETATFAISEVRWGLTPGIIVPQLNDAIGARQMRRYALTGERFGAAEACRIGLVHEVVPAGGLDAAGARVAASLLANGPAAIADTKAIILRHAFGAIDGATCEALAADHGDKRRSAEAAEGLASFAEKRPARWRRDGR